MGLDFANLTKPLAGDNPCGEDLQYDRRFMEILRLAEGKPEDPVTGTPAEDPNWRELRDGCIELLARGRHLQIMVWLSVCSAKMEGYAGLKDGLAVLRFYLENQWPTVYPLLDPDDNNDPTMRVNIIGAMAAEIGTFGDPLRFLERVRECPLCESRQLGKFSLKDIAVAGGELQAQLQGGDAAARPKVDLGIIDAAFEETDNEVLEAIAKNVEECLAHIEAIDAAVTKAVGAGNGVEMGRTKTLLRDAATQVRRRLAKKLGGEAPAEASAGDAAAGGASGGSGGGGGGGGGGGKAISGEVSSQRDVILALDKVVRYYEQHEPSSPVALIVACAKAMVGKNFLEITRVLDPTSIAMLEKIQLPPEGS
ncbi:MAG: type VI secretion system protein TssA [Planctomycetota bacterium]|nr:type VI secretion system protein TssA [Planctomycetota bacterium]